MALTFFLKFDEEIVKVSGSAASAAELLALAKDRFGPKMKNMATVEDVDFYVKDAQYGVFYEIEEFSLDMYEGAVVEIRLAEQCFDESAPIELQIQTLRQKIENLEEANDEPIAKRRKMNYTLNPNAFVLRLRGLPWGTNPAGVAQWFQPIEVAEDDVFMVLDWQSKPSGEAYVEFKSRSDQEAGKRRHKDNLGGRYIEVFDSTGTELHRARCPPSPSALPLVSESNLVLRMRGLPFGCSRAEVEQFFKGVPLVHIHMITNKRGLETGEAFVELATEEDCVAAQRFDKERIQARYIELFRTDLAETKIPKFYVKED